MRCRCCARRSERSLRGLRLDVDGNGQSALRRLRTLRSRSAVRRRSSARTACGGCVSGDDAAPREEPAAAARSRISRGAATRRHSLRNHRRSRAAVGVIGQGVCSRPCASGSASRARAFTCSSAARPASASARWCERCSAAKPPRAHALGWCYLHNFEAAHRPIAIALPAGLARTFQARCAPRSRSCAPRFRPRSRAASPAPRRGHPGRAQGEAGRAFTALSREVETESLRLVRTPGGFAFAPVRGGEVLTPEQFAELPEDEQKRIQEAMERAQASSRDHPAHHRVAKQARDQ